MKKAMKKICLLSLTAFLSLSLCSGLQLWKANADTNTVYVSVDGSNSNAGTESAPYASFQYALSKVSDGGTIVIKDNVSVGTWVAHGKTVTVTGGALKATYVPSLQIQDNVTFKNTEIQINASSYICANGYTVVMDEGVSLSNAVDVFAGGDEGSTVAGTSLTLLSGEYKGYVAIWTSNNENVARVDRNGRVMGVRPGTAVITAKLGSQSVECTVTVKENWSENY